MGDLEAFMITLAGYVLTVLILSTIVSMMKDVGDVVLNHIERAYQSLYEFVSGLIWVLKFTARID